MTRKLLACTLFLAGSLAAQTTSLQFEVASIRPAEPITVTNGAARNVGVYIDRNQFRAGSMTLRDYLAMAYELRVSQIEGPEWIASDRFDINATIPPMPEGRKLDGKDLAAMMRPLVEERFQLKTHRTSRDFSVYALVQTKDGIKATESPLDPESDSITVGGGANGQGGATVALGRGSALTVGGNKIGFTKASTLILAETLARFLDRPVMDQTGLTSTYDFLLELTPEDFQALMIRSAIAAGVTLPPQATKMLETATDASVHDALAKFGLKLESKKAPMDVLIVDSASRVPTEN